MFMFWKGRKLHVFLCRMAVCSVPPVKPSTGRKLARSPKARWRSTASASHFQDTQTVEPSISSTAFHLEYRYVCQTPQISGMVALSFV